METNTERLKMNISTVKQPIITQSERNKIKNYQKKLTSRNYTPWVTVRQSRTHGQGQILTSHKADHAVHLLSLGELNVFLKLEHDPTVIQIFEQFPLCIFGTMKIAKKLNIVHRFSSFKKNDQGSITLEPYCFKYKNALDSSKQSANRTKDKLKIETEYWSDKSAGLQLVNESFYCLTENYNLLYLRDCFDYPEFINPESALYVSAFLTFSKLLSRKDQISLKECIERTSIAIGIESFHAECVFKHACYEGLLPVDLSQKMELWLPVPLDAKENPYAY